LNRFLCSSPSATIRTWSNARIVPRATSVTILIIGLTYVHVPIYTRLSSPTNCAFTQGFYTTFYGISNLIIFSLGPSVGMIIFGLLTIRNVRRPVNRVVPINTQIQTQIQNTLPRSQKATDRQLIRMMILQSVFFIMTSTPTSLYYCYSTAIANVMLSALQVARNNLASTVLSFLSLAGPCMSFYVFTISSQLFRRELIHLFKCRSQTMQMAAVGRDGADADDRSVRKV
jgi:hypothetical protein